MPINPIALAIPAFFLMIGIEYALSRRRGVSVYRFNDSIADLSCGISQQTVGILLKFLTLGGYVALYDSGIRLFDVSGNAVLMWFVAMVYVDVAYYWWHRASHRVNFLWGVHAVHHQSQEYNLSVALRQALFSPVTSLPFYIPMAFMGIPPLVAAGAIAFSTLYQFWIHTRIIGRMGLFEEVFNTASHHRVHHGINPRYIDKNYAAILIIWDRMFGTFERETEEPVYGTVKPFTSWNPIWANFEYWVSLWQDAKRAPKLRDKILIWFKPPEWSPEGLEPKQLPAPVDARTYKKWDLPVAPGLTGYVAYQLVLIVLLVTATLFMEDRLSVMAKAGVVGFVLGTLLTWSGLLEGKRWAVPLEWARLGGTLLALAYATGLQLHLGQGADWVYLGPALALPIAAAAIWFRAVSASWRASAADQKAMLL